MRELMVKAALDDPRRVFGRWDAIEVGDLGIRLLLGRGDAGGAKILDNCVDTEVVIRPVAGGAVLLVLAQIGTASSLTGTQGRP